MNGKNQFGIDPESVVNFVINGENTSEKPADTVGEERKRTPTQDYEQQAKDCSDGEQKTGGSAASSEPNVAPVAPPQEDGAGAALQAQRLQEPEGRDAQHRVPPEEGRGTAQGGPHSSPAPDADTRIHGQRPLCQPRFA